MDDDEDCLAGWQKMDDLVSALRAASEEHYYAGYGGYDKIMRQAADEIERLLAENEELRKEAEAHKANANMNYLRLMAEIDRRNRL
jgi:hypothetical protein